MNDALSARQRQKLTREQPEPRRESDRPEVQVGPETMHSAPPGTGRSKSSLESSLSAAVRPGGTGFNVSWAALRGRWTRAAAQPVSHRDGAGGSELSGPLGMGTGPDTKH